jgi:hypothetical protein
MNAVFVVINRRAFLGFRGDAIGDDLVAQAALVDETDVLVDIPQACAAEIRARWRFPRGQCVSAVHRGFAAVEADDSDALAAALLTADELLGKAHA